MNRFARGIVSLLSWLFSLGLTAVIIGGVAAFMVFEHYSKDLPDYSQLSKYEPPNVTRLYAADGKLLAEYATEKRVFVPLKAVPKQVIHAFLAAEDKNFYEHTGIDYTGLARAVRDNIINYGKGKSLVGGSTITQQVVKNFLLSSEKSIERKIKEAILAVRISTVYSKDKILELYLNQIYLGLGSYGVAAAAQNYFNKSLDELTLEEAALLATQPKAPNTYNPKKNYDLVLERRNWVIDRMKDAGFATAEEAEEAKKIPIILKNRDATEIAQADFFAEEVRRQLVEMYGSDVLYQGGLVVKTTLNPQLQKAADKALRLALMEYDRRRGYRGAFATITSSDKWKDELAKIHKEQGYKVLEDQKLAVVSELDEKKAKITFADGTVGYIPFTLMKWTRRIISDGVLGPEVKKPADILKKKDVVLVGVISEEQKKLLAAADQKTAWDLQQVPEVNGGFVAIDPHTGRVLAMSGGYAYGGTEFNRVTQAKRQPGSAFKPFVYLAGLENGFTPSTIVHDGPVEMEQGAGQDTWKPQNYGDDYLGDITMRVALEKSRNTVTVRIAQMIGIDAVLEIGKRFGIYDNPARNFSIVLGAAETTLMKLANAYGILVNGGKYVAPSLIERIDDRHGKTIYRRDTRACIKCEIASLSEIKPDSQPPLPADIRDQVVDERVAYQMISILEGATVRGTGARAKEISKVVGGKTGTTNDSKDTWFIGFSPDLVAGVYVGYDSPKTMGAKETGASVALPAFISFMKTALADKPNIPFRVPSGIQFIKVDMATGQPLTGFEEHGAKTVLESFITGKPLYIPGVSGSANLGDILQNDGLQPEGAEPMPSGLQQPAFMSPNQPVIPPSETAPPVVGTGGLY
ncbi:MAG: penicillin-binding protein 1A [Alphaproteobacteria bacterium]